MTAPIGGRAVIQFLPNFSGFAAATRTQMNSLASRINNAGTSVNIGLVLPVAAAGIAITKTVTEWSDAMKELEAVMSGGFADTFEEKVGSTLGQLSNEVRAIARESIFTLEEIGQASVFIARTGVREGLPSVLSAATDLAAATKISVDRAADILTNIGKSRGIIDSAGRAAVADLERLNDIIFATTAGQNVNIEQFWNAWLRGGPVATALGRDMEEIAGIIGFMGDRGFHGSRASTALLNAMTDMLNPTEKAKKIIKSYGLTLAQVNPEQTNMVDMFQNMADAGVSVADAAELLGKRAAPAFLEFFKQNNLSIQEFADNISELDPALIAGATAGAVEIQQQSVGQSFALLKAAWEDIKLTISEVFNGENNLVKLLQNIAGGINEFNDVIKRSPGLFEKAIKGLVAFAAIGPINFMFVRAAMSFQMFLGSLRRIVMMSPVYAAIAWLIRELFNMRNSSVVLRKSIGALMDTFTTIGGVVERVVKLLFNLTGTTDRTVERAESLAGMIDKLRIYLDRAASRVDIFVSAWAGFMANRDAIGGPLQYLRDLDEAMRTSLGSRSPTDPFGDLAREQLGPLAESVSLLSNYADARRSALASQGARALSDPTGSFGAALSNMRDDATGTEKVLMVLVDAFVSMQFAADNFTAIFERAESIFKSVKADVIELKDALLEGLDLDEGSGGFSFDKIVSAVRGFGESVGWVWQTFVKPFWHEVIKAVDAVKELWNAIPTGGQGFISDVVIGIIFDMLAAIPRVIQGIAKIVTGIMTLDFGMIMKGLGTLIQGILGFFSLGKVGKAVATFAVKLGGRFLSALGLSFGSKLVPLFLKAFEGAMAAVRRFGPRFLIIFRNIFLRITRFFAFLGRMVRWFFNEFMTSARPFIVMFIGFIRRNYGHMTSIIRFMWVSFRFLFRILRVAFTRVINFIIRHWRTVLFWGSTIWNFLKSIWNFFGRVQDSIKNSGFAKFLVDLFTSIWDVLKAIWDFDWGALFNSIKDFAVGLGESIKNAFVSIKDAILDLPILGDIIRGGGDLFNALKKSLSFDFNNIGSGVGGALPSTSVSTGSLASVTTSGAGDVTVYSPTYNIPIQGISAEQLVMELKAREAARTRREGII